MFLCWKNDEFSTCKRVMLIPRTTVETRSEDAVQNNASDQSEMRTVRETYIKPIAALGLMWAYRRRGRGRIWGEGGTRGESGGEKYFDVLVEMLTAIIQLCRLTHLSLPHHSHIM